MDPRQDDLRGDCCKIRDDGTSVIDIMNLSLCVSFINQSTYLINDKSR